MPEKNVALIGAGYWGKNLVRNFHQLGVLKTICDQSSAIRQQMAKDYPDTTVTDDFNAGIGGHDAATSRNRGT
jgi:UDP-2-acetamido-3-amino-2,3-dideoxy-glucuronate N-acetyltransferase